MAGIVAIGWAGVCRGLLGAWLLCGGLLSAFVGDRAAG